MKSLLVLMASAFLPPVFSVHAMLNPAPVFGDNMVLQAGKPLPVWGKADAGDAISVQFAGQTKTASADSAGNWKVRLEPLRASGQPRALTITAKSARQEHADTRQFSNVLVGEVWLAAGQSNMEFPLSREAHAAQEIPSATNAQIRLMNLAFAGQYFYARPFGSNEVARLTPEKFFQGAWKSCSPQSAREFSAIAYYFGRDLQRHLGVPVGIIHCAVGGSPAEAWVRRAALEASPDLKNMTSGNWLTNSALDDWCRLRGHQNLDAPLAAGMDVPGDDMGPNHSFKPGFLWDAGPARLARVALAGVLWYQGESNALEERRVRQHEKLFPVLVRDWRAAWGSDFPFLFCQLSSIRTNHYQSAFWPEFRDQQRRFVQSIPNTGMAVTSDHGLPDDVHPREKREIGRRLALVARARVYGEAVEFSGPLPAQARAQGPEVELSCSHAEGLSASDGRLLRGFELAGSDGRFHAANARIAGELILLAAPEVHSPRRLRYGWQPFSAGNLVNGSGLPASTFELPILSK